MIRFPWNSFREETRSGEATSSRAGVTTSMNRIGARCTWIITVSEVSAPGRHTKWRRKTTAKVYLRYTGFRTKCIKLNSDTTATVSSVISILSEEISTPDS